jgi:hypothetical protein
LAFLNEMTRTISPRIEGEQVKPPGDRRGLKVNFRGNGKRNPVFHPIDLVFAGRNSILTTNCGNKNLPLQARSISLDLPHLHDTRLLHGRRLRERRLPVREVLLQICC